MSTTSVSSPASETSSGAKTKSRLYDQYNLKHDPAGPLIVIPDAFEGERSLEFLTGMMDKLLWQDLRLIACCQDERADNHRLQLFSRKYPTKCAVVLQASEDEQLALIQAADLILYPGQLEQGPPATFDLARATEAKLVIFGSLPNRQAFYPAPEKEASGDASASKASPAFFYSATSEGLWDVCNACIREYAAGN